MAVFPMEVFASVDKVAAEAETEAKTANSETEARKDQRLPIQPDKETIEAGIQARMDKHKARSKSPGNLEFAMLAWFPTNSHLPLTSRKKFTESDLRGISDILRRTGKEAWSKVPRTYSILRIIGQIQVIDSFLAEGLSDLWLPFTFKTIPETLKEPSSRVDFLEAQKLVLTKALDLEQEDGKHRHFSNEADIPLTKIAELGKGGFGYVDRVLSTISYKEYARKLIPRGRTFKKDQTVLRDFERELSNLKRLSHPHIVELIGSYTDPKFVGIIMSPVADCNLREFLDATPLSVESISLLRTFFGCLTAALCYLHENRIRHKDIKPLNVLVKGHQVLLTDFGISLDWAALGHSTTSGPTIRSPRYCSPEVADDSARNSSSDIWSLGCIFLEMWTVLVGETVAALLAYLEKTDERETRYYLNLSAVKSWCRTIGKNPASAPYNAPRAWIAHMMRPEQQSRWTAHMLLERIEEVNADEDTKYSFSGLCCLENDESAESVYSPSESGEVLETTRLTDETVKPTGRELTKEPETTPSILGSPVSTTNPVLEPPRDIRDNPTAVAASTSTEGASGEEENDQAKAGGLNSNRPIFVQIQHPETKLLPQQHQAIPMRQAKSGLKFEDGPNSQALPKASEILGSDSKANSIHEQGGKVPDADGKLGVNKSFSLDKRPNFLRDFQYARKASDDIVEEPSSTSVAFTRGSPDPPDSILPGHPPRDPRPVPKPNLVPPPRKSKGIVIRDAKGNEIKSFRTHELMDSKKPQAPPAHDRREDLSSIISPSIISPFRATKESFGWPPVTARALFDFTAEAPDELTVKEGDLLTIVNDLESDDWWVVQRISNGRRGNVPASYIEVHDGSRRIDVTPKVAQKEKEKPPPDKVRVWTDRTGSFRVEGAYIAFRDPKVHIHKTNGVKIAVPVEKFSDHDLEYVRRFNPIDRVLWR